VWRFALTFLVLACSSADSNRKDAFRQCQAAIAAYPNTPAPPCATLHMCANEAQLSNDQRRKLMTMIRAQPGCAEP
jgi:hypothetical protein